MNQYKQISFRLLALLSIYFALLTLTKVTGFDKVYLTHFVNKGNAMFSNFGNGGEVKFIIERSSNKCSIQFTSKQQKKNAIAKAKREGKKQVAYHPTKISINSWNHFGVLVLFWIACIIVLPISWKPKLLVAAISYLLVESYFYIKLWTKINLEFSKWYDQFQVGWQNQFAIDLLNYFLLIISYPFFGLLFVFLMLVFLSRRFLTIPVS